ncbi:MAG: Na+/H+ antiporter subunit E, partial [Candidatus Nanohalobium sp.]
MKKYRFYAVLMAATWLLVRGSVTPQSFVVGLIVSYPIAFSFRRFYQGQIKASSFLRTRYLIVYVLHFVKELFISNLDVAYRVLHPSMPADEDIIEYNLDLESSAAITVLANSITLTPGTLVIDHIEEDECLLIHCLNMESEEEVSKGIEYWENLLKKAFG